MWAIIIRLLKELLPILFKTSKPTAEMGEGPGKVEEELKNKLKEEGW